MSITIGVLIPMLFMVGVVAIAEVIGLSGGAQMLVGGATMFAALAAWEYSPLKHTYGFMAGSDASAGYWGWRKGDSE